MLSFARSFIQRSATRRPGRRSAGTIVEAVERRLVLTSMEGLGLTSASAVVLDSNGVIVGELNPDDQDAMASTTKIMTVLLAIEAAENTDQTGITLDDIVTIGTYPTQIGGSTGNPQAGEQFVLRDMLQISMGNSDNEITQAIAEYIVGQTSTNQATGVNINNQFATMMNNRAAQMGLDDTQFRNPHGRDPEDLPELGTGNGPNRGHFSTARDLATLGRIAMQNATFSDLAGTTSETVTSTLPNGSNAVWNVGNTNRLLTTMPYPGAEGVKGGLTDRAGAVLVSQATILGRTLNAAVMDSDSVALRHSETHQVLNFGFEARYGWTVDENAFVVQTNVGEYDFNTGVFTVEGTSNADHIQVWRYSDQLHITVNGSSEWLPLEDLTELAVTSGAGDDFVQISGIPANLPTRINTGNHDDTIVLGAGVGLSIIDRTIAVDGGGDSDSLKLNDLGAASGQEFVLGPDTIQRSDFVVTEFTNIESLRIDGTNYEDRFVIDGIAESVDLTLAAHGGFDSLNAADQINEWIIDGANAGQLNGDSFSDIETLSGGSENDVFAFVGAGSLSGSIHAGKGTDGLDYSAYSKGVIVNLEQGTASTVDGKVRSVENVIGSAYGDRIIGDDKANVLDAGHGIDLLIGGDGKDRLSNKSGTSILIGGKGADRLDGSKDGDLMIAGTTTHGQSLQNWEAILGVWSNAKWSLRERREILTEGILAGRQKVALNSTTVFEDDDIDELFGADQLDWIWKSDSDRVTSPVLQPRRQNAKR